MPGVAPAKVQHMALKVSRAVGKECTPYWEEEAQTWVIALDETIECGDLIHMLLKHETGGNYSDCSEGHTSRVVLRFRRGAYRQGLRPWKDTCRVQLDDGAADFPVSMNQIMALLAKPTNPQGEGKASSEAPGSNKQQMSVKRSTVIRV